MPDVPDPSARFAAVLVQDEDEDDYDDEDDPEDEDEDEGRGWDSPDDPNEGGWQV